MKKEIDIITTKFDRIWPKDRKLGFWDFLTTLSALIFAGFYLIFLTPMGWVSIVICTLLFKFVVVG
jgi:hypothetical protein